MIATRFMELRKRRGLMVALAVVNIGIPSLFLLVRLLAHAIDPSSYGPAGGYDIYRALVAGVMYVFGFIIAATVGATVGSADLTEGMFRHLVITGRSRLALYLARIPAGLAIVASMVAAGFIIVCAVCTLAAPTQVNYDGTQIPAHLSLVGFERWAGAHEDAVLCNFPYDGPTPPNAQCGPNGGGGGPVIIKGVPGTTAPGQVSPRELKDEAVQIAREDYPAYKAIFLSPSVSLMVQSGLWVELEATIGFIVGLGLASLLGQRTVAVVLMIVLEVILTPIFSRTSIPHMVNLQRGVVGLAMAHIEPSGLPAFGGGDGGGPGSAPQLVPETVTVAICVIVAWLVVWTAIGAWRMMTRDA